MICKIEYFLCIIKSWLRLHQPRLKNCSVKYAFNSVPHNQQQPHCLLREKTCTIEATKSLRLQENLNKMHPHRVEKNLNYLQSLKNNFQKRKTMGTFSSSSSSDDLCAYRISLLTVKSNKSPTKGTQLILPVVEEALKTMLHKAPDPIIPLNNSSVRDGLMKW